MEIHLRNEDWSKVQLSVNQANSSTLANKLFFLQVTKKDKQKKKVKQKAKITAKKQIGEAPKAGASTCNSERLCVRCCGSAMFWLTPICV
jgi:hypothetical protein